jgi:hypothetical protein
MIPDKTGAAKELINIAGKRCSRCSGHRNPLYNFAAELDRLDSEAG